MTTGRIALVTGGAGFIGSHLVERLLAEGWGVRVLDNLSTGSRDNLQRLLHQVEWLEGDIRDATACQRACRGVDSVFHMAALASVAGSVADPVTCHDVNITGTLNMLTAARDRSVRRFVFSSSASVYGNAETLPTVEGQLLNPQSPYASAKACGEFYCRNFWELYGLETVVLRYFNVFGPRQSINSGYAAAIPRFVNALLTSQRPVIYGDGLQTRDFVCVANVVAANIRAGLAEGAAGQTFNIAGGQGISLLELLQELQRLTQARVEPEFQSARAGEVRHSVADISRARKVLGYEPAVSLGTGLRLTVEAAAGTLPFVLAAPSRAAAAVA
jgi:nucleoside-diphosphate-sugar epimerase